MLQIDKWWKKSNKIEKMFQGAFVVPVLKIETLAYDAIAGSNFHNVVVSSTIGHRASMEDTYRVVLDVYERFFLKNTENLACQAILSFFGVFDGHGGQEASLFVSEHLLSNIVHSPYFKQKSLCAAAVKEAFLKTDSDFLLKAQAEEIFSGTTAIVAFLQGEKLLVANCGDSRAVLCRQGKAIALSEDHKPSRPDERHRIETAGGLICLHQELDLRRLYRLNPELLPGIGEVCLWMYE